MKAHACYRPTVVAVILVNHEFSLLNVFFQSNYRRAGIVEIRERRSNTY